MATNGSTESKNLFTVENFVNRINFNYYDATPFAHPFFVHSFVEGNKSLFQGLLEDFPCTCSNLRLVIYVKELAAFSMLWLV